MSSKAFDLPEMIRAMIEQQMHLACVWSRREPTWLNLNEFDRSVLAWPLLARHRVITWMGFFGHDLCKCSALQGNLRLDWGRSYESRVLSRGSWQVLVFPGAHLDSGQPGTIPGSLTSWRGPRS